MVRGPAAANGAGLTGVWGVGDDTLYDAPRRPDEAPASFLLFSLCTGWRVHIRMQGGGSRSDWKRVVSRWLAASATPAGGASVRELVCMVFCLCVHAWRVCAIAIAPCERILWCVMMMRGPCEMRCAKAQR